jgi:Protein of unknown function (DUF2567)
MSTDNAPVTYPRPPAASQAPPAGPRPWFTSRDLGPAAAILAALAAAGAVLGLIWEAISPRTKGFVYLPNAVIPEENESLIAADARFLLLTGAVGIVAALAAWLRRSARGPATALALVAGGLLGALLTDFVGRLAGGGHATGALNAVVTLPLRVQARGLLLVEPAIAAFVYAACALFARRDDLGVPAEQAGPAAAKLLEAHPSAGEAIEWPARRIDVTLDREVAGSPDWLRVFARSTDGYDRLALDPPTTSTGPGGAVTYSFAVAQLPGDPPWEIVVQLRRPEVDAPSLDGGQWAFTAVRADDAP